MIARSPTADINLARLALPVTSLGPRRRLVLWVAGCPLRCPGCISPDRQSADAGKPVAVKALADHVLAKREPLDGVSLSGGEPFVQAAALRRLGDLLHCERRQCSLLVLTGYTYRRLRMRREARPLLAVTHLLIAGPYRRDRPSSRPLLASANQEALPLSPRGQRMLRAPDRPRPTANLGLNAAGQGWLVGILDPAERRQVRARLGIDGLR